MRELSIGRIGKLMRLELVLHRRYYAMLVIGTFLFTFLFLLFVWYKNSEAANDFDSPIEGVSFPGSIWEKSSYLGIFIGFKLLVFFVVIAQSFKELRNRSSAEFYLLLPSSVLEKLTAQFVFLITLAELILPFVFWENWKIDAFGVSTTPPVLCDVGHRYFFVHLPVFTFCLVQKFRSSQ